MRNSARVRDVRQSYIWQQLSPRALHGKTSDVTTSRELTTFSKRPGKSAAAGFVYGVGDNNNRFLDLTPGRDLYEYFPLDGDR
jgi:hypothetical protein